MAMMQHALREAGADRVSGGERNESFLRSLIDGVKGYAIIFIEMDGTIGHWNRGAQTMKGYRSDEILGKNFRVFYTEEDLKLGTPEYLINRALRKGQATDEGQRVRQDGSLFWAHVTLTTIYDEHGEAIGFTKVTCDLSEMKVANDDLLRKTKLLEASEVRFRHMVEEIQDYAILLLDPHGHIENWNRGAEHIKGYSSAEIVGKHFRVFYTDEARRAGHPEYLINTARREGRAVDEGWRVKKDGSLFWACVVFTAIHDRNGNITGFSKLTRDLTQPKRAEEALRAKNAELENFAFAASHDLKAPLRNISFLASLVQEDFGDQLPEECRELVDQIFSTSVRMDELVNAILVHARLGMQQSNECVDLNEVLADVLDDLAEMIRSHQADIQVFELPALRGDSAYLRRLFQNLIENGLKYCDSDCTPRITIDAQVQPNQCTIAVSDNSIGIAEEHHERIFAMFQRLPTEKPRDGLGVGLTQCAKIVSLHSGKIWVESNERNGSTFFIQFPLADHAPTETKIVVDSETIPEPQHCC